MPKGRAVVEDIRNVTIKKYAISLKMLVFDGAAVVGSSFCARG